MKKEKSEVTRTRAENGFAVIFDGRLIDGLGMDDAKRNIAKLYGTTAEAIDRLFSGTRMIVKKNAPLDACRKIKRRFEKAGAICRIVKTPAANSRQIGEASATGPSKVLYLNAYKANSESDDSDINRILKSIVGQLSGGHENDIPFLLNQCERFDGHKLSLEIRRAIGRMIFDMMPQDDKQSFFEHYEKLSLSNEILLEEAKMRLSSGDRDAAEALLVSILPDESYFQEDSQSRYFCSHDPFEACLFMHFFEPDKKIRFIPPFVIDCSQAYTYLLVEKGEYEKARQVLDNALRYNPVNLGLLFESNEINKINKRWTDVKKINDFCISIAYTPEQIARAYRNYGYMYFEMDDLDAAICCYLVSLSFDSDAKARSELFILSQRKKKNSSIPIAT